jgi:lysozyme family protein
MISNWAKSFGLLIKSEGGYVNNPADPGGRTNLGVTQAVWENWIGHASGEKEMKSLTPEIVEPLYKKKYWDACRCDNLPSGIDYLVFDAAVLSGVGFSAKTLQKVAGATIDGAIGPKTIAAVVTTKDLIEKFSDEKATFYKSLPTFSQFGNGWLDRIARVKRDAYLMV